MEDEELARRQEKVREAFGLMAKIQRKLGGNPRVEGVITTPGDLADMLTYLGLEGYRKDERDRGVRRPPKADVPRKPWKTRKK